MKIFHRSEWVANSYDEIVAELERDPTIGLGITVAGYVHKKEEINGVFVKSLVNRSSAAISGKIKVHDLISEVNGLNCENLSHADSVRLLVNSGSKVCLKVIRFKAESMQAKCLQVLQEQENSPHMANIQKNLIEAKNYWQQRLGSDFEILTVTLIPDQYEDGGLGISLEGTVDIIDGNQLCPHHYVECLRKDGPAAKSGCLKAGDELLQLNNKILYGESHVTVRRVIGKISNENRALYLVVARRAIYNLDYDDTNLDTSLPEAYDLLVNYNDNQLVKAKSDTSIATIYDSQKGTNKLIRSQSLQHLTGMAIWNCVPLVVTLMKDNRGLGFSICDYHVASHPTENVIIVRSLVPGGVAQADGRIVPGDRLMFVNSDDLSNCTLDKACDMLKSALFGPVRLGIAKPIPIEQSNRNSHFPIISRSERLLAISNSPSARRRTHNNIKLSKNLKSSETSYEDIHSPDSHSKSFNTSQACTSLGYYEGQFNVHYRLHSDDARYSVNSSSCSSRSNSPCLYPSNRNIYSEKYVYLPSSLERTIRLNKGSIPLGLALETEVDKNINGCVVKSIHPKYAMARDGRIQTGDYIIKMNSEKFRNVTSAQSKAMLKRMNYIGTQCTITYITSSDARLWKQKYSSEGDEQQLPFVNRLSPKVFPKFYQSPLFYKKDPLSVLELSSTVGSLTNLDITKYHSETSISQRLETESLKEDPSVNLNKKDTSLMMLSSSSNGKDKSKGLSKDSLKEDINYSYLENDEKIVIRNFVDDFVGKIFFETLSINIKSPHKFDSYDSILKADEFNFESEIAALSKTYDEASDAIKELQKDYEANKIIISTSKEELGSSKLLEDVSFTNQANVTKIMKSRFWGPPRNVVLSRDPNKSFGISIVGGRIEVSQRGNLPGSGNTVSGIFIKSVLSDSPAGRSGALNMGDRVISVSEIDVRDATHERAVKVIKNATNPVTFCVQSLQTFSPQNFKTRLSSSSKEPVSVTTGTNEHQQCSIKSENDQLILTSKTPVSDVMGHKEIDTKCSNTKVREVNSAASLVKLPNDTNEEDMFGYTQNKVIRKYNYLPGEPTIIRMKSIPKGGFDFKIADNNMGFDKKKSIFIMGITTPSSLNLENGDELLEINGHVLLELSTDQASLKIQQCIEDGELSLIILRHHNLDEKVDITASIENHETIQKIEKLPHHVPPTQLPVQVKEAQPKPSHLPQGTTNHSSNWSSSGERAHIPSSAPVVVGKMIEKHALIETGKETLIEIDKDGKGLGLSIVGGSDTVLGTVVIHEVYADGAAATDGRLKPGDQVLEVNDISLRGISHDHAISLLRRTPSKVRLLIYRDVNLQSSLLDPTQIYNIFDVDIAKKHGRGLGISIVGRKNEPGVYISEVVSGGAADEDNRLMQGDQILGVNNQDTCVGVVSLKVGRWKLAEATDKVFAATPPTITANSRNKKNIDQPKKNDEFICGEKESGGMYGGDHSERSDVPPPAPQLPILSSGVLFDETLPTSPIIHKDLSPVLEVFEPPHIESGRARSSIDQSMEKLGLRTGSVPNENKPIYLLDDLHEDGSENLLIELKKLPDQQLGMGIGKRARGILVTSLQAGSNAHEKLKVGDRIMAVNGEAVTDQLSAVKLVKSSAERLILQIARPKR
uniref:Glutamate receptor-interacting protein 1 n=1 Tax=Rhabditophanes sp. KR3021 TaxID=114890 RepID=A0AC35U5R2_9BILA